MPTFRYIPLGQSAASTLDAPDRAAALRALRSLGVTPTSLEEVPSSRNGHAPALPLPRRNPSSEKHAAPAADTPRPFTLASSAMSRSEFANFISDLATALSAGLPLVLALRTIGKQGRSPRQRAMIDSLIRDVEHGKPLADAAHAIGKPFTDMTIHLIRAGESSGRLSEVLAQAAALLDRELKLRREIFSALIYPAILVILVITAIIVFSTVIVPNILGAFEGQVTIAQLPWPTRVVKGFADFMSSYWWLVIALSVIAVIAARRALAQPDVRRRFDAVLLRIPVLRRFITDVAVARFTRTLGTLLSAGLPVITSLRITRGALGNLVLQDAVDRVCDDVAHGKGVAEPLEAAGCFPPLLVQVVGVGERTGRLPNMLTHAAESFEARTQQASKLLTSVLPPLVVVIAALVIGFIIAAVILPLTQMSELIG